MCECSNINVALQTLELLDIEIIDFITYKFRKDDPGLLRGCRSGLFNGFTCTKVYLCTLKDTLCLSNYSYIYFINIIPYWSRDSEDGKSNKAVTFIVKVNKFA